MARADEYTLLPLDYYARLMAIHPDAFNQVVNPVNPYAGACERVWIQYAWMDYDTGRNVGREELAQAIYTAEEMIAYACGFWPAPLWSAGEEKNWPRPARGRQVRYPPINTNWGYVIEGGQRALTMIDEDAPVVYSASILGGVLDTATINITAAQMTAASASREEVAVFFADEITDNWWISYLTITEDATTGDITIVGRRSQFVDPDLWEVSNDIALNVNANFVTAVDVYRRYNDPSQPAQVVWKGGMDACSTTLCADTCQTSCLSVDDVRQGIVRTIPGTYSGGAWAASAFSIGRLPDKTRLWYYHGILQNRNMQIRPPLAEAIVRLANTYLVAEPCGCDQTRHRWQRDREEADINTYDAAMAMSYFGTTMRGAVFAWSVIKRLAPLATGGALT